MGGDQTSEANLAVGISDLISRRECPRRAAYGARRHTAEGEQDHASRTPEAGSPATWYGSMLHDAIDLVEDGFSDDAAAEQAWLTWGHHLGPDDLALLKDDLRVFHERDFTGVRTVLAEGEIRVPLTELDDGTPIYFRGRIDRLYERLDRPGQFIHVDYKSSKWLKNQEETDTDLQLWAYNWSLYEYFPEIEDLAQWLDQLRGGMVPTRKSAEQREEIREWLAIEARAYFGEEELQKDGLPAWRFNQWCPWCPILESCGVIPQLTDWALSRIEILTPDEEMSEQLARLATPMDLYVEQYDDVQTAIKTLQRFEDSTKNLVRDLPETERARLGFELRDRRNSVIGIGARNTLYEMLGHDRFIEMAGITQEKLKSIEDPERRDAALSLVEKVPGNKVLYRKR